METEASDAAGGCVMWTLREMFEADALHAGAGFHWPWDTLVDDDEVPSLDLVGKCLHCEDVYDDKPWVRRIGDALAWDPEQEMWVCTTPGCDGTVIDFMRKPAEPQDVKGEAPKGA